jgi:hypothetical protein
MAAFVLLLADATSRATAALVIVTGVLVIVTGALVVVTAVGNHSAQEDAEKHVKALDKATSEQSEAMRESTAKQVASAQDEITAMRETTAEQVAAARNQLDASHRPLLIEVMSSDPIPEDLETHDNPDIVAAPGRVISQRITLELPGAPDEEIEPCKVFVRLASGSAFVSVPLRNIGRGLAVIDNDGVLIRGPALADLQAASVSRQRVPVGGTTRVTIRARFVTGSKLLTPGDRWLMTVPYADFAGRQQTTAAVSLACLREPDGPWHVVDVSNPAIV